jgi:hypothetical protein
MRDSLTVGALYNTIQEPATLPSRSSSSVEKGGVVWLRRFGGHCDRLQRITLSCAQEGV